MVNRVGGMVVSHDLVNSLPINPLLNRVHYLPNQCIKILIISKLFD